MGIADFPNAENADVADHVQQIRSVSHLRIQERYGVVRDQAGNQQQDHPVVPAVEVQRHFSVLVLIVGQVHLPEGVLHGLADRVAEDRQGHMIAAVPIRELINRFVHDVVQLRVGQEHMAVKQFFLGQVQGKFFFVLDGGRPVSP